MIFSSINFNFSSFEVLIDLLVIIGLVRLVGGMFMKLIFGEGKTYKRDEITLELNSN